MRVSSHAPLVLALVAAQDGGTLERSHHSAVSAAGAPTQCDALTSPDLLLLGQGRCVNRAGLEPRAFGCDVSATPECTLVFNSTSACALSCLVDDGCTGFEMRQQAAADEVVLTCRVFFSSPPSGGGGGTGSWALVDNGTQPATGSQLSVVSASAVQDDACCYKRAYPRPCPHDNPPVKPPQQSASAKEIYDRENAQAAAASKAALPALVQLIDFCATQGLGADGMPGSLFDAVHCPGMADLTENGTLATFPSAAQIVQRFYEEMWVSEFGHAFGTLFDVRTCVCAGIHMCERRAPGSVDSPLCARHACRRRNCMRVGRLVRVCVRVCLYVRWCVRVCACVCT